MLISHYKHLQLMEDWTFGMELIIQGAKERLAPILMTALTTALALLPIIIGGNRPGQEIEHPMARWINKFHFAQPDCDAGSLLEIRENE
jgi:Cu/Ag efflux pump CusA